MNAPAGIVLAHHDGAAVDDLLDEIAELYLVIHQEAPYNGGPLYSRERFLERIEAQKTAPGFSLVTARAADALVGFSFGFTFGAGRWWGGTSRPAPPDDIVASEKFAVIELDVGKPWRGQGLGRALMASLLTHRPEPHAILLSDPEAPARRIYERWGWQHAADVRPADDAPWMHALVRPLTRPAS